MTLEQLNTNLKNVFESVLNDVLLKINMAKKVKNCIPSFFFKSFNAWNNSLDQIKELFKSKIITCSSLLLPSSETPANKIFKYRFIKYGCKFGQFKNRKSAKLTTTKKHGCPFFINLQYKKGLLKITDYSFYHNHNASLNFRKPPIPNYKIKEILSAIDLKSNMTKITQKLNKEFGAVYTKKEVKAITSEYSKKINFLDIINDLKEPNSLVFFENDHKVEAIFYQKSTSKYAI